MVLIFTFSMLIFIFGSPRIASMDRATFERRYSEMVSPAPLSKQEQALEEELDQFEREWDEHQNVCILAHPTTSKLRIDTIHDYRRVRFLPCFTFALLHNLLRV